MTVSVERQRAASPLIERVLAPFQAFVQAEASSGIVLLACTAIAMMWANSPAAASYEHLWHLPVSVKLPLFEFDATLAHWINDGLMVVFFFVVGLEIKRELVIGELASASNAALPIAAAAGGMLVPAALYAAFNLGRESVRGWGIPMATDIAFALGALSLLGSRVPPALKIFLVALAIVDDIGAVLVIAVFYTSSLNLGSLLLAAGVMAVLIVCNRADVRRPLVYCVLGLVLWAAVLESGIHQTVAGVLLAFAIPSSTRIDADEFLTRARAALDRFGFGGRDVRTDSEHQEAIAELETACEEVQAPLQRIERTLHPFVAFGIMPVFALANAGVPLHGDLVSLVRSPITTGVLLGLLIGKPIGITLFAWLAVRVRLASLGAEMNWRNVHAVAWLGGIGFTMSLFIASLAFAESAELTEAKLGVLGASIVAGTIGALLLMRTTANGVRASTATATEAS